MENLLIPKSSYTPEIDFNASSGIMTISGKSYPENTFEFYTPIHDWIINYFKNETSKTFTLNLELEYLNSSSLKAYFDMFDILEDAHDNGHIIVVKWIFDAENDIIEETGEDFIEDFKTLDITLVKK